MEKGTSTPERPQPEVMPLSHEARESHFGTIDGGDEAQKTEAWKAIQADNIAREASIRALIQKES